MVRSGEKQADITAEFDLSGQRRCTRLAGGAGGKRRGSWCCAGSSMPPAKPRPDQRSSASVTEVARAGCHAARAARAARTSGVVAQQHDATELLDRFADAGSELRAVQAAWRNARDAREALTHAKAPPMPSPASADALETDLQDLRLRPGQTPRKWAALTQEQSRLSHSKELLQTVESTRAAIADDDGVAETLASLAGALAGAERIDRRSARPATGRVRPAVQL